MTPRRPKTSIDDVDADEAGDIAAGGASASKTGEAQAEENQDRESPS